MGAVPGPHSACLLGIRVGPSVVEQCGHDPAAPEGIDRWFDKPAAEAGVRVADGVSHPWGKELLGQISAFEQWLATGTRPHSRRLDVVVLTCSAGAPGAEVRRIPRGSLGPGPDALTVA